MADNMNDVNSNDPGAQMSFDPTRKFVVKRTGKQIARMQTMIKRSAIAAGILMILVLLLYCFVFASSHGGKGGDFTVRCDPNARNMVSLCETEDFKEPTMVLRGSKVDDMWNIAESWLPADIDGDYSGSHNGTGMTEDDPSYLAYTFYLKNVMDN